MLFGSGFTSLIYQTAWQKLFRLIFGVSTVASAAVLGIFLGGLGAGALLLGPRVDRHPRPLKLYGELEIGVALLAALSPALADICGRWYLEVGGEPRWGTAVATVLRLSIAALVMGPPVLLMGGTLPAVARAVTREGDTGRRRVASMYASNTAGAVAGALLSTFLLLELLGTRLSLWGAVLVNLLIGVAARAAGRKAPGPDPRGELAGPAPSQASGERAAPALADQPSNRGPTPRIAPAPRSGVAERWLVYLVAAGTGGAFLGSELVWYRMLAPLIGGSSFGFGLILALALAGIGLGGAAYARRADRPASLMLLGRTLVWEAAALGLPLALGDGLAVYAAHTRGLASLGFAALVLSWAVVAGVVVLPPACIAGFQFPAMLSLLGRGREGVGRDVSRAYAYNTAGALLGALATGLVLLPRVGALGTWRGLVALLVGLGLACAGLALRSGASDSRSAHRRGTYRGALSLWAAAGLAGMALAATGPTALWRHSAVGAGRSQVVGTDRNGLIAASRLASRGIAWQRDGRESTVAMGVDQGISFIVNGKSDGAVLGDRGTQTMLGLAPAAMHPAPERAFVLGLGTGMTAGWLARVPGMQRVDVAELEPAVLEVARAASLANENVLENPTVHVFVGDGRQLLFGTEQRYDLVISEPSNPYRAGIASLFTAEFYRGVDAKLERGGILAQWVQGYEIDVPTLRVVLTTLRSVFPSVQIWHTQSDDLMLIATREPLRLPVERLRARLAAEPFATAMPRMWLTEGAEGFLAHFLASAETAQRIADAFPSPINTDDTTVLEYAFARQVGVASGGVSGPLFSLSRRLKQEWPPTTGTVDWARAAELRPRAWSISGSGEPPPAELLATPQGRRATAVALGCRGDFAGAARAWPVRGESEGAASGDRSVREASRLVTPPAEDSIERWVLGNLLAARADGRADPLASWLGRRGFLAEAHAVRARMHAAQGNIDTAAASWLASLGALRSEAPALCNTAQLVLGELSQLARAHPQHAEAALSALLRGPLAVYQAEAERHETAKALARFARSPEVCLRALGPDLEFPLWNEATLLGRLRCLHENAHPAASEAEADLARFLENTPGRVDNGIATPGPVRLSQGGP